ncbi:MAG: hypothetical protein WCP85_10555 [Mariniphaga sp.]
MGRQYAIFLFIIIVLGFLIVRSCQSNESSTVVESEFPLDTTVHFKSMKNLANGLSFDIPETFVEKMDPVGQGDSSVYFSKQKDARLTYFVEGNISQKDSTKNPLSEYYDLVRTGQHSLAKNSKTNKSQAKYIKNGVKFSGNFFLTGTMGDQQFVWKTLLSEVPVGGNPIFRNMMFVYPIAMKAYYQPIGVALAQKFGEPEK